eukprot:451693-Rhodomonas_salina.2
MSTRKKRKESRSIWRPTARFSHSRRILVLTTYGACANTYSTTLMARPDSTCSVSKSGRSGICPFWTFTSPIRNMLSGSTPSGGCFVRPRKRANMRTRADVAIHWFRFATMLISACAPHAPTPIHSPTLSQRCDAIAFSATRAQRQRGDDDGRQAEHARAERRGDLFGELRLAEELEVVVVEELGE